MGSGGHSRQSQVDMETGKLPRARSTVLDQEQEMESQWDLSLEPGAGFGGLLVVGTTLAPLNFKGAQHVPLNLETGGGHILRLRVH